MGCLDTYKNPDEMSPRLSFSNDFVESHHATKESSPSSSASPSISFSSSSDFEFSALTNHIHTNTMTAADELFFKGKLLPTLRDELLLDDDDEASSSMSFVPPKGLPKWKDFLSLKRLADAGVGSKTGDGPSTANNNQAPKIIPK